MSKSARYYKLFCDRYVPGRWYIKDPLDANGEFGMPSEFLQDGPLRIEREPFLPVSHPGLALDFTEAGVGIMVISQRLRSLYERLGLQNDCQFIPCHVDGKTERYFIFQPLRIIKCIDEARCRAVAFDSDGSGRYSNVRGLKIDPTKVGDANIFRPWGWTVVLIISERVKLAMEEEGITGAKFIEV